jgi:hypothetical protein
LIILRSSEERLEEEEGEGRDHYEEGGEAKVDTTEAS